jgi:LAGLIDADG endonuclease
MVYAMFSIGILGFLVWSQQFSDVLLFIIFIILNFCSVHYVQQLYKIIANISKTFKIIEKKLRTIMVALHNCEVMVINFAICWNSLVLINTFSCKNLISYIKSAGNMHTFNCYAKSSSETIRETSFNFSFFSKQYIEQIGDKVPNKNWLIWFIGFSEGDGAILTYNGRTRFVLTQKDSAILYHIQKVLGFGTVRQFDNFSRFIVDTKQDILLLFYLFNGNLVLAHRKSQLGQWLQVLNNNLQLIIINKLIVPSLLDPWLSGFTDAESCFNVNIEKRTNTITGFRVILRFLIEQKNAESLLLHIRSLFGFDQVILRGKTNAVYRYHVNSFKGLISVKNYFLTFPLKSKKGESFNKWNKVYNMVLNKEHLILVGLDKIRILAKTINKDNSLN